MRDTKAFEGDVLRLGILSPGMDCQVKALTPTHITIRTQKIPNFNRLQEQYTYPIESCLFLTREQASKLRIFLVPECAPVEIAQPEQREAKP